MKRKKRKIWAGIISATLITAGLILGCGGDGGPGNNGGGDLISISVDGGDDVTFSDPAAEGFYNILENEPLPASTTVVWAIGSFPSIIITFQGKSAGTYNVEDGDATIIYSDSTGQVYAAMETIPITSGTVTVTEMSDVGSKISGTFNIIASRYEGNDPGPTTATLSGSFSVTREKDEPGFDRFFGSLRYETDGTGFFRVEQIAGQWWLVTPEGHPFFSTGINALRFSGTPTADGVKHYEEAVKEKYGTREAWAQAQFERCKEWGWNTVGSWSDWELFKHQMPYTVLLGLGQGDWLTGELADYFSEEFRQNARQKIVDTASSLVDDPFLVGYFLDNELRWGRDWRGGHLFDDYMAMDIDTCEGKQALMQFIQDRYETVAAVAEDFETGATSWEELGGQTELPSRETEGAIATRTDWVGVVAEKFFSTLNEELKAVDPNHLNLGVRFVSQLVPRAAIEAAGAYVDVMSINFYDLVGDLEDELQGLDPDYLPIGDFLSAHYEAGGRPILISEWGYRAADSGLPNTWPPIYPVLATQEERADAYEAYFRELLDRPWFVGQHWFLYTDQPAEGRFDGENNNFGLGSEQDEPYELLVKRSAMMHRKIYKRLP